MWGGYAQFYVGFCGNSLEFLAGCREVSPAWRVAARIQRGVVGVRASERVDIHDLHATMLHRLGLEHTRLIFPFQGRDFRLTDVTGKVIEEVPA